MLESILNFLYASYDVRQICIIAKVDFDKVNRQPVLRMTFRKYL
jgi:hypothetical protein